MHMCVGSSMETLATNWGSFPEGNVIPQPLPHPHNHQLPIAPQLGIEPQKSFQLCVGNFNCLDLTDAMFEFVECDCHGMSTEQHPLLLYSSDCLFMFQTLVELGKGCPTSSWASTSLILSTLNSDEP